MKTQSHKGIYSSITSPSSVPPPAPSSRRELGAEPGKAPHAALGHAGRAGPRQKPPAAGKGLSLLSPPALPRGAATPSAAAPPGRGSPPRASPLLTSGLRRPPAAQVPWCRRGAEEAQGAAGGWHRRGLRRMGGGARSAGNLPRVPRPRSGVPGAEGQPPAAAPRLSALAPGCLRRQRPLPAATWRLSRPRGAPRAQPSPAEARCGAERSGAEGPGRAPGAARGLRQRGRGADVRGGGPGMAGLAPGLRAEPLDTAWSGDEERSWSRFSQHLKGKVVVSLWCCFVLSIPNLKPLRVRLLNTTAKHPAPALT